MIKPDMIPDEVVEAALKKRGLMREAIAAALNAWPGVDFRPTFGPSRITLPLTQEGDA